MPQTIKNDKGEDVEVFSKEEVDQAAEAKATEERERLEAEKQDALEKAETEKEDLQKQLDGYKDKEFNFNKLRDKKKKDGEGGSGEGGGESQAEIQQKIDELSKQIATLSEQPKQDVINDFVKANVPEDKEVRDKFNYYLKKLGAEAKTKEEVTKAATEALQLATGKTVSGNDNSMLSVGANQNYRNQDQNQQSETSKKMQKAFGISDETKKKYGKKK